MASRRVVIFLIVVLLLLPATGCWDQVEIEDLAIIHGMAIDYLPGRRAPYLVTMAVKKTAELSEEKGGGGQSTELYTGVGASIDLAIQQASFSMSRHVFFSHTEVIIVSEDMAKLGISALLDLIIRHPELRVSTFLVVTPGMAHDVLKQTARLQSDITDEILGLIEQAKTSSEADPQEVFRFLRQMTTTGQDPHTALIIVGPRLEDEILQLQPGGEGGGDAQAEQEQILSMDGLAVFRGDKLAGTLNHIETRGYLWLADKVEQGLIMVQDPVKPQETVQLFISRASTTVTPLINDGKISFRIEVEEEGDIYSQTSAVDLSTPEMIEKLNSAKAAAIKVEIEKALRRLQELESDVVGFGSMVNRKDHKAYRKIADRWPEIFKELEVEIIVKAFIRRTGQHSHPARVNR